jgi:hypothetical protein
MEWCLEKKDLLVKREERKKERKRSITDTFSKKK